MEAEVEVEHLDFLSTPNQKKKPGYYIYLSCKFTFQKQGITCWTSSYYYCLQIALLLLFTLSCIPTWCEHTSIWTHLREIRLILEGPAVSFLPSFFPFHDIKQRKCFVTCSALHVHHTRLVNIGGLYETFSGCHRFILCQQTVLYECLPGLKASVKDWMSALRIARAFDTFLRKYACSSTPGVPKVLPCKHSKTECSPIELLQDWLLSHQASPSHKAWDIKDHDSHNWGGYSLVTAYLLLPWVLHAC